MNAKEVERFRNYIEFTIVWKDKRRKKSRSFLELKELRLLNQFWDDDETDLIEFRVKEHFGTKAEFEKINFGKFEFINK